MRAALLRAGVLASAVVLGGIGLVPAAAAAGLPAAATALGQNCVQPGKTQAAVSWAQQMLGPERVWPFATGAGVTVAVLDSGVDARNQPQLRGRVTDGTDFIDPKTGGVVDCTGHGTQVAGIIAAQPTRSSGFRGLAPNVHLLSARVSDAEDGSGPDSGTTGLAHAIDWAVRHHADIINISLTTATDDPLLQAAVHNAEAAGAIIIAAAGNNGSEADGNPILYPAAYPGVVAVGAIGMDGARWDQSEHHNYVKLMAPGVDITSTQAGGGLVTGLNGTSYAAAFVTAAAALVLSHDRNLKADDVVHRLYVTATPAPGGLDTNEYGHGIVNPYAAVLDGVNAGRPAPLPGLSPSPTDPAALAQAAAWRNSSRLATALTAGGVLVALLVLGAARALPLGRRRSWRAGMSPPVRDDPEPEQAPPPVQLFDESVDA